MILLLLLQVGASCLAQGDPARGRAIVASRQAGLCLFCHRAPVPEEPFQGDLGPDLAGVGSRLGVEELKQRIADPAKLNPSTIMPSYGRTAGRLRVAPEYRGKPILTPEQIEDVVAYLATLRK